jgi:GNAT superfamily N-acetyltransferase
MEQKIRPAHIADLPYIYDICLKTALSGQDATYQVSDKFMIGQYFAAPYLHFEIDVCFIVTDKTVPLGYILGTSDSAAFYDWMNTMWLPSIRSIYPVEMPHISDFERFVINVINQDCHFPGFLKEYPAHLHIDLLPQAQRMGMGNRLISKFIDKLKSKGVPGLHLSVGEKNQRAVAFYKKVGFLHLATKSAALFMGKKL